MENHAFMKVLRNRESFTLGKTRLCALDRRLWVVCLTGFITQRYSEIEIDQTKLLMLNFRPKASANRTHIVLASGSAQLRRVYKMNNTV